LVTDIDGDGQNEVVLVTREPKLKIFKFKGGGAQNQNFHTLYSHKGIDWDQLQLVVSTLIGCTHMQHRERMSGA
jgi:hypothetical protein